MVQETGEELLACDALSIGYGRTVLLRGVALAVLRGQVVAMVGPNGAGKTTLLHTLIGLTPALAGTIRRAPGLRLGYVPQRGASDPIFPVTALDVVKGGGSRSSAFGASLASGAAACEALQSVGLYDIRSRLFRTLSGGQQQRVLLARALVRKPDLLALDEPTAGMDLPAEWELMTLIRRLAMEAQISVVWVTHQLHLASRLSDKMALINGESGLFVVDTPEALVTSERLSQIFGHPMHVMQEGGTRFVVPGSQQGAP